MSYETDMRAAHQIALDYLEQHGGSPAGLMAVAMISAQLISYRSETLEDAMEGADKQREATTEIIKLVFAKREMFMNSPCPHAKSPMTPCVLRDGPICFAMNVDDKPICVGCERTPKQLGVEAPADWDQQVASYYARRGRQQ